MPTEEAACRNPRRQPDAYATASRLSAGLPATAACRAVQYLAAASRAGQPYAVAGLTGRSPDDQPYAQDQARSSCTPMPARASTAATPLPEILTERPGSSARGYDARDRIVYESCAVIPGDELVDGAERLLGIPRVGNISTVRARASTCYQCRVERA